MQIEEDSRPATALNRRAGLLAVAAATFILSSSIDAHPQTKQGSLEVIVGRNGERLRVFCGEGWQTMGQDYGNAFGCSNWWRVGSEPAGVRIPNLAAYLSGVNAGVQISCMYGGLVVWPNGRIRQCKMGEPHILKSNDGQEYRCKAFTTFSDDGAVTRC